MDNERKFLHQISNHIATASVNLEIALEEMEAGSQLESPQLSRVRLALGAIKELMKSLQERRLSLQTSDSDSST